MRRTPLSSVRIFVESTPSLTNLLRHCAFGFVLVLGGCQKQEPEQSADKKMPLANTELDETKRQFEADVEKSKQNAVSRFPELGVAGSEMNKAFVARVTHLRALNSPEFNYTNWPYQLACQVDYEVQQNMKAVELRDSKIRRFTVPQLLAEKAVPFAEIWLKGVVTKVETGVGNKLSGMIVIDRKIRCDFEFSNTLYGGQRVELTTRGDLMQAIIRDAKTSRVLSDNPVFRVGQHVELKGRIHKKPDGSLAFKFMLPDIGLGLISAPNY